MEQQQVDQMAQDFTSGPDEVTRLRNECFTVRLE